MGEKENLKMKKLKLNLKRAAIGAGTIGVIVAGAAAFSAFESHTINVTARIENALFVQEDAIDFGTVFPQEYLTSDVRVALSDSFLGEDRVDDIRYVIKQKPKVKEPCRLVDAGVNTLGGLIRVAQALPLPCDPHENPNPGDPYQTIEVGAPYDSVGPAWRFCEENLPENAPYGLTEEDLADEYWQHCYLPLANYISKHETTVDGDPDNDKSIDAFHQAYQWEGHGSALDPDFIATGYLAKSDQDTEDSWTIDLAVPCFVLHCAQEADNPQNGLDDEIPGFYVPLDFRLPTSTEHLVFGTDLWIEVTGVSLAEQATTLTVIKEVINNNGGNAQVVDFILSISGVGSVTSGVPVPLAPGDYTVEEDGLSGYDDSFSGDCDSVGEVTLNVGDNLTCTITNDDLPAILTLTKIVLGCTAGPNDFDPSIDGNVVSSGSSTPVNSNTALVINEISLPNYSFIGFGGDAACSELTFLGDTITLSEGQSVSCTLTNDLNLD